MREASGHGDAGPRAEWVDGLPEEWHRRMVGRAAQVLPTFHGLRAVLVTGSLSTPAADRYSDLDLSCVVDDDAVDWWRAHWREAVTAVAGETVLAADIGGPVIGGFCLTPRWEHVDLIVFGVSGFSRPWPSTVLHDPDAVVGPREPNGAGQGEPYYPAELVELFFYLLGAGTVTLGRGEVVLAHGGVLTLRDQLIALMLAENGLHKSDGAKRLNPHLTPEQRRTLLSLPTSAPDPSQIVRAYRATADEFVP